jgi:5-methylthioribose kinase
VDYEFLNQDSVADYLASRPEMAGLIDPSAIVEVKEVGDGNLNLVFIISDRAGKSVVLKQALPYVRLVGPDWPMTPSRAAKEANALRTHHGLAPDLVPQTFFYDPDRFIIGMEDLSDYRVWRGALMEGLRHDGVASQMGDYVARVAFGTSVLGVDAEKHKDLLAVAVNPELCKITEDLVFTEPHVDIGRNAVLPANEEDAKEHANDADMIAAMGYAKWLFMTQAEALIHGDLHTGSVMVKHTGNGNESVSKAFDSEFAFYGPVAFDLGALLANYTLSASRWIALGDDDMAQWSLSLVGDTWQQFEHSFRHLYPERIDARVWKEDLLESLITRWRTEMWLFAAAKMSRRIVGLAKVADVETLDPALREGAARGILRLARQLVSARHTDPSPENFISLAGSVLHDNTTR